MSQTKRLLQIKEKLEKQEEQNLSSWASLNSQGLRRVTEPLEGHRQTYAVDCDRILHSKSYTRHIDKTQVFYMVANDHITHRVLHVQLVSKIGRTIGRFLGLNQDLIEAIALGHDIGHPPFGHDGETILSKISSHYGLDPFQHNIQSVRALDLLEKGGRGLNLTLQVLDGILCHDGEVHQGQLSPAGQLSFAELERKISCKSKDKQYPLTPMTMEGCVVRLADTIAYIGRDIEDAIELKLIDRQNIPAQCAKILGKTNGTIVYRLVTDLIDNSYGRDKVAFSPSISEALGELKSFNYQQIYLSPKIKKGLEDIEASYYGLFESYIDLLDREDQSSAIYHNIVNDANNRNNSLGLSQQQKAESVRDFIAGMTDAFFIAQAKVNSCAVPETPSLSRIF